MKPLTTRQRQILDTLRTYVAAQGRPPTRAELACLLGFRSPNAAEQHLQALARKGAIALEPGLTRNIRLLEAPAVPDGLPLIGRIAAGTPILAVEHIEAHYRVAPELFAPRADYLLRVQGLSMRDAGILEGDLLAVHRTPEARAGQIVVARLNDEVTVKRFAWEAGRVRLLPDNPEFAPLDIDPRHDELVIEGIAVGIIRTWRL